MSLEVRVLLPHVEKLPWVIWPGLFILQPLSRCLAIVVIKKPNLIIGLSLPLVRTNYVWQYGSIFGVVIPID